MGFGDRLQERQELVVGVTRIAGIRGDLAGGDLQRGEQAGGAVADVVVGLLLGNALAQRQDRLGPVQGLDLALLVDGPGRPHVCLELPRQVSERVQLAGLRRVERPVIRRIVRRERLGLQLIQDRQIGERMRLDSSQSCVTAVRSAAICDQFSPSRSLPLSSFSWLA